MAYQFFSVAPAAQPTPLGPGQPGVYGADVAYGATVFRDCLYLLTTTQAAEDRTLLQATIQRYGPASDGSDAPWETLWTHQVPLTDPDAASYPPLLGSHLGSLTEAGQPVLYALVNLGAASQLLLCRDGQTFEPVSAANLTPLLPYRLLGDIAQPHAFCPPPVPGLSLNLPASGGLCQLTSLEQTNLQDAVPPEVCADPHRISQVLMVDQQIYMAITDPVQGFQLWVSQPGNITPYTWRQVIAQGAYRYSQNQRVMAMVAFQGDVYLLAGPRQPTEAGAFASPELLRVYPDDSWDVIIGNPRFTPLGLKLPLGAMGPGFEQRFNRAAGGLLVHDNTLYALLYAVSPAAKGAEIPAPTVELWGSTDAETWQQQSFSGLLDQVDHPVVTPLSTPEGLVLFAHSNYGQLLHQRQRDAAALEAGEAKRYKRSRQKRQASAALDSVLNSTPTDLVSATDRMTTHRHQRHLWADVGGTLHGLFNYGSREDYSGLTLCTSTDDGLTWQEYLTLPHTASSSSSDTLLVGDTLWVACSTTTDTIALHRLQRTDSPTDPQWQAQPSQLVIADPQAKCSVPTLTLDPQQRLWCAYVHYDNERHEGSLKLVVSADEGQHWQPVPTALGTVNNATAKSGLLLNLPDRVMVIYTDQRVGADLQVVRTRNAAYRLHTWPVDQPWVCTEIYEHANVDSLIEGQYGSHFSALVDDRGNVHFATQDSGRLMYFRLAAGSDTWADPLVLTEDVKVAYLKLAFSSVQQRVLIVANLRSFVRLYESDDYGTSFTATALMLHPTASEEEGNNFARPQVEVPAEVDNILPVLQQYQRTDGLWGVLQFAVKLDRATAENAAEAMELML